MFEKKNITIAASGVALALMLAITALNTQTALASTRFNVDNVIEEATDQGIEVTREVTGDKFTNPAETAKEQGSEVTGEIPFTQNDGDMRN